MHHIEHTVDLDAPAAEVWALAGTPSRIAEWLPALDSVRMEGDVRIGTMPDGTETAERIVRHSDADHSYTYVLEGDALPITDYESTLAVQDRDGGSRVVWSARFDCDEQMKDVLDGFYRDGLAGLRETLAVTA